MLRDLSVFFKEGKYAHCARRHCTLLNLFCVRKLCSFRCTGTCGALRSANPTWLTEFTGQCGGCTSVPLRTSSGWDTETVSPACSCQVQFTHDVTLQMALQSKDPWSSTLLLKSSRLLPLVIVHRCGRAKLRRPGLQSVPQRQAEAGVGGESPAGEDPAGAHQPRPQRAGTSGQRNLPAKAPGQG